MHGTLQLNYSQVKTLEDAKGKALQTWRQMLEDPEANLPSSVHFQFVNTSEIDAQGQSVMSCTVTMQLDRTALQGKEAESE